MLVIRMQRTGRKGHAMFRVVVQDSRRTPTSGKIVAQLGSYDPHSKTISLNKEKTQFYLDHGAQPSERTARMLKAEGIKLPTWVKTSDAKAGKIRNLEKLRRNRPAEEVAAAAPAEEASTDETAEPTEAPAEETASPETTDEPEPETADETPVEEVAAETPAEEAPADEDAPKA